MAHSKHLIKNSYYYYCCYGIHILSKEVHGHCTHVWKDHNETHLKNLQESLKKGDWGDKRA